jgi:hypothetical protein
MGTNAGGAASREGILAISSISVNQGDTVGASIIISVGVVVGKAKFSIMLNASC